MMMFVLCDRYEDSDSDKFALCDRYKDFDSDESPYYVTGMRTPMAMKFKRRTPCWMRMTSCGWN